MDFFERLLLLVLIFHKLLHFSLILALCEVLWIILLILNKRLHHNFHKEDSQFSSNLPNKKALNP